MRSTATATFSSLNSILVVRLGLEQQRLKIGLHPLASSSNEFTAMLWPAFHGQMKNQSLSLPSSRSLSEVEGYALPDQSSQSPRAGANRILPDCYLRT